MWNINYNIKLFKYRVLFLLSNKCMINFLEGYRKAYNTLDEFHKRQQINDTTGKR